MAQNRKNLTVQFSTLIQLLSLALGLTLGDSAFAYCKMSREPKLNYFISYEADSTGVFGDGGKLIQTPTTVERCQQDAGSYMMVSLGVRRPSINSDTADISFDGKLTDTQCRVKNSFLKDQVSFAETSNFTAEQYKALRTCTYLQIYDLDGRPMTFQNEQAACKITTLQNNIVKAEGDYCFFRIQASSRFAITTIIKPECKDENFLKAHHINPQDIEASLNTYVVGDDTGRSEDVTPIGSSRVRVYIAPHSKQLTISEDNGPENPRFPTAYAAEVHMGDMKIRGSLGNYVMDMSLLVDNRMARHCQNGFCTSPSDFDMPVVGEVELQELKKDGTKNFIDSWWHAGVAQPRWQGLLKSTQHNLNEVDFKPGTRYSLTVTFIDPYEDFSLFKSGMQQLLIDLRGVQGTAGLDAITPLASLGDLIGLPNLENLPSLSSPDMSAELDRLIETLRKFGQDRQWPFYYDSICDSRHASCAKAGKTKFYVKLTTEFTVAGEDSSNHQLILKDITVKRDAPEFESYKKSVTELPKAVCGGQ